MKVCEGTFDLIVSIVKKGDAEVLMEHAKKAGAEGGTILNGRGTGIHEGMKIFGVAFQPEREVILILAERCHSDAVFKAIYTAGKLDVSGNGISFMVDVSKVAGIVHLPAVDFSGGGET
ncbi:P-II family nitrogen regulator [Breznakiella homolactica]|uniref:P-II family nitrogen regulator n=1 Tax=Breznakiella homolactica TaxID=2798577 RepID=A0A7T7XK73_9SPIR|nr:P-II family nitrogen regulator [Breznakiella homolactica]QQO07929.1 P-II family nitrogen regulator [Breznakiella homolactica]